jgi:hypothetical protein
MKQITAMLLVLAAFAAGCGSGSEVSGSDGSTANPSPSETSPSPDQVSPLEGTWRTGSVTQRDTRATLRKYGLAKWIKPLGAIVEDPSPIVFTLKIHEGKWDLYGKTEGGPSEPLDYDARYKVHGNTVVVSHEGESNTYRWSVKGDTLTLKWLDTTYGANSGIPEEVFQRALYMTGKFQNSN